MVPLFYVVVKLYCWPQRPWQKSLEKVQIFPLTVEFVEKYYAAGKFAGGYIKREARPSKNATLISRLIDRPLRPCFPKDFYNEVQMVIIIALLR